MTTAGRRIPGGGSLAGRGQQASNISSDGQINAIICYGDHEEVLKYNLD